MWRSWIAACLLVAACGKAKDDSPRGRCERGCARMRTCIDARFGKSDSNDAACVNLCLKVGPPDDARLEFIETAACSEVLKPDAKVISVPRQEPDLEGPIQTPGGNK
jgi:hypothetical protein